MNLKVLSIYLKDQRNQIQTGGWPVARRKLRSIMAMVNNRVAVTHVFYLLLLLTRYLAGTLVRRHSTVNLIRFGTEFSAMIQQSTTYQSNEANILAMNADLLIASSNPGGAIALYQQAVAAGCRAPEVYLRMGEAFYLQGGKYEKVIKSYETGLKLLEEEAINQGLSLFGIRIINEETWGFNIGHIAYFDVLVKLSLLGLLSPERRVVFVRSTSVSNLCYLNYWKQYLNIIFLDNRKYSLLKSLALPIAENISAPKLTKGFVNHYSAWSLAENSWCSKNRPPLLKLSDFDRERGQNILDNLSISRKSWFVCLHVREGETRMTRSGPDSQILTYIPAIKAITARGGWVIRMGHLGMTALPPLLNVIDYANTEYKSDWMDVFLWASCKFFIGTSSGPLSVPPTFGKSVLLTNACAIGITPNIPNSLMLPKLFWSREKNRLLTFQEILDGPMGWTVSRVFDGIDCDVADNTPEEIELAVMEMLDRLEHSPQELDSLSDLQKRFTNLRMRYGDTGQMPIAETFAQKHRDLL